MTVEAHLQTTHCFPTVISNALIKTRTRTELGPSLA